MEQPKDPLTETGAGHEHAGHAHAHTPASRRRPAEVSVATVDPAQQSLSDALRVSFWLLRFVMIALVVVYVLFSGMYQVAEQEAAVVTRFGKIVQGEDGSAVRPPGFYFGWPFPIQQVIKVPTAEQSLPLSSAFVYEDTAGAGQAQGRPLNPEKDGSLITGDANIVHARFNVTWRVTDPVDFVQNVGAPDVAVQSSEAITGTHGQNPQPVRTGRQFAEDLVRNMAEQGIVHAVANVSADDVIGGRFAVDRALATAQRALDELEVGITINNITILLPEMPVMVRDAYDLVSQAEAERGTKINDAERERTRLLGEAAGKAALPLDGGDGPLVSLIKDYEIATAVQDKQALDSVGLQLREAFRSLSIAVDEQPFDVGGQTATVINNAQIDKSNITQRIRTEAQTVARLAPQFRDNPELFKQLMWQSAVRDIFSADSGIELFYAPEGSALYLEMNRDPQIVRTKERARLDAAGTP